MAQRPVSQLPPDLPDFVGRADLLASLRGVLLERRAWDTTAIAVSAVAGKAGVGKTTLAIHLAHTLRSAFPDGQLYANLRGADAQPIEPADVLAGFLYALEVDPAAVPDQLEQRSQLFRARMAGRRMLVVLDNAASEAQVRPLLPGNPEAAVLITSRSPLAGLDGVAGVQLDVFQLDEAMALLTALVGQERVQAERDAAARIVRFCGCLPLAVRIAGAKLVAKPHWTLEGFARRLGDRRRRLDELQLGDREVRSSFALSYQDRDDDEKRLFRLLALVEAAEFPAWVAGPLLEVAPPAAEGLLDHLEEAQLIEVARRGAAGHTRFRFHDLLRDYARERLDEEEPAASSDAALRRLLSAYVILARQAQALLDPQGLRNVDPRPPQWQPPALPGLDAVRLGDPLEWLAEEQAALSAAVRQLHDDELWEPTWLLTDALSILFDTRSLWSEWQRAQELALDAARRAGDRGREADALRRLGDVYRELGHYDKAIGCLQQALPRFREQGMPLGEAWTLRGLGMAYRASGNLKEAIRCLNRAMPLFQEVGNQLGEANTLRSLGDLYRDQGRFQQAIRHFRRSVRVFQEIGVRGRLGAANALRSLGYAYLGVARYDDAVRCFDECLVICREQRNRSGEAWTLRGLGTTYLEQGRLDDAVMRFGDSLAIFQEQGNRLGEAVVSCDEGIAYWRQNRHERAVACLRRSLDRYRELGDQLWVARILRSLGQLYRLQGQAGEAEAAWREALAVFRDAGAPDAAEIEAWLAAPG
jgi:tetratricopeptide (TPR) repeat protein